MSNEENNIPLKDTVLARLRENEVHMRPRAYFVLRMAALGLLAAALLGLSVFVANYLSFMLRATDHLALLSLGWSGFLVSLLLFPWWTFALMLILVFLFEQVTRTFSWGYRTPVGYLLGGMILGTIAFGVSIDRATSLNDQLFAGASRGELPQPFNTLYRGARPIMPTGEGVFWVRVLAVDGDTVFVRNESLPDAPTTTLTFVSKSNKGGRHFSPGDRLYIIGETAANNYLSVVRFANAPSSPRGQD